MKALIIFVYFFVIILAPFSSYSQAIIINHENAFLEPIPAWAIKKASDSLHIAYGHTSHGSQITYGMKALANQTTDLLGYKGDFYCWKEYHEVYGDNPCLDIDDGFKPGDLGHNGDTTWAASTRDYLLHEERAKDINVVMWSWCGGCSDNTDEGIQKYLNAMSNLEQDFPDITFIYMTGHLDHWSDATLKHNNQLIRDYCIANNKVLYDFADIESYDPDNNYFEFANDNCDYYNADGSKLGNWAEEWQNSHVLGHDWYQCSAAHSKPLNGNRKAYAAWWMWARLIGWQPDINIVEITQQPLNDSVCDSGTAMFSIDFNSSDSIRWQVQTVDTLPFIDIFENDIYSGTTEKSLTVYTPDNSFSGYKFRCKVYLDDTFAISNPAYLQVVNTIPAIVKYYTEIICYDLTFFGGKNPSPGSCKWNVLEGDAVIGFPYQNETDITNLSHGKNTFEYITSYLGCNDTLQFDVYRYDSLNIINQDTLLNPITGDDLSFSINIAGDLEFAQWYKGDNILNNGTKYSSVNSPNLLIKNVENSDKGYYWCDLRGYCNEMFSDSVFVDITNATSNSERESNIIIYPNPVNNRLNIKSNQDIMSIEVYGIN
ncbi:MAG TPA: hypothetical protein ENK91_12220, partial [Bacteroidetes bacterium]|nr:hypothetical protein [Bacteroidota bacterium]